MAAVDYSVKNCVVLNYKQLTEKEILDTLGASLFHVVNTAHAFAGAATSVYVLRGSFGTDIIGRFEQLVGIIGGTVIGSVAGCIVFSFSGYVAAAFVTSFVVGALAGGIICVMTALREQIFRAVHRMWTTAMEKVRSFATAVGEAVQNALAKVVDSMTRAYSTICATLERVGEALRNMNKEQRDDVLQEVQTAVDKVEASINKAVDDFQQDIENVLAKTSAKEALKDEIENTIETTKESNTQAFKQKMEAMKCDTTTQLVTQQSKNHEESTVLKW